MIIHVLFLTETNCAVIGLASPFCFVFIPWKSLPPLVNLLDDKALQKMVLGSPTIKIMVLGLPGIFPGDFGGISGGIQPLSPVSSSQWMVFKGGWWLFFVVSSMAIRPTRPFFFLSVFFLYLASGNI